ncbi:MAG: rRNA maturation RNase YbeY [Isosphaeraceae bacterium]|nr:rRNA maturation RNase YbeY [Isosphaeraceae bacterium]
MEDDQRINHESPRPPSDDRARSGARDQSLSLSSFLGRGESEGSSYSGPPPASPGKRGEAEEANPDHSIDISDTQHHLVVSRAGLTELVERTLAAEGVERYSLSIALVDNATIHALNGRHLGHDWPTDVISFPLSEPDEPVLAGELIVSAEMAAATAREAGVDPWAELALYVVHGLLHLCGYDDLSDRDADVMRRREGEILALLGLTNTFPLTGLAATGRAGRESAPWPV